MVCLPVCIRSSEAMKLILVLLIIKLKPNRGHPCHCIPDPAYGGALYDCRSKGLKDIPKDIGRNATTIDLGDNNIAILRNHSLSDMPLLQHLRIDENRIQRLEDQAFYGIPLLEVLNLTNNNLVLDNNSYPHKVFAPLNVLKELYIGGNSKSQVEKYPDDVFVSLRYLEILVIDAVQELSFGPSFRSLVSLKTMRFNCTCVHSMYLRNTSFINLPYIHNLDLTDCPVMTIDSNTFRPLVNLTSIILRNARYLTLESSIRSLDVLRGRYMTNIDFTGVYFRKVPQRNLSNRILTKEVLKPLTSLCVKNISLAKNFQIYLDCNAFLDTTITSCLRYLDVSQNMFMGGSSVLILMQRLTNLEYLNISNQYRWNGCEDLDFTVLSVENMQLYNSLNQALSFNEEHAMMEMTKMKFSNVRSKCPFTIFVYLPPKLKVIDMSRGVSLHHAFDRTCIFFKNTQYIEVIHAAYVNLQHIMYPVMGLQQLEHVDLSGNDLSDAIPSFFDNLLSLKYLSLCKTKLGQRSKKSIRVMFQNLKHLEKVELSSNHIKTLSDSTFSSSENLSILHLDRNLFQTVPSFLSNLPHLTVLDMSQNMLSYITITDRFMFETLNRNRPVTLKLRGNNFLCGCETLDFITWLSITQIRLDNEDDYFCTTDSGASSTVSYITDNYMMVWRRCIGRSMFYISFCMVVLFLFIVTLSWIIFINITKVKHFLIRLAFGRVIAEPTRRDYSYDVYIGYCEEDWECVCLTLRKVLEEGFGLRLFLRDRDSHVSLSIADEIIRGISCSWTTVLLLSPDFLDDLWMTFIIERAIFETRYMPTRLVVILVGEVDVSIIPSGLLDIVPEDNILETFEVCSEVDDGSLTRLYDIVVKSGPVL